MGTTVLRADVVKLCEALGFKTADKWNKARMQEKLVEIAELAQGDDTTELEDVDQKKLLQTIVEAEGDVNVVQTKAEMEEEPTVKKEASEEVDEDEEDDGAVEKPAKAKKAEKAPKEKKETKAKAEKPAKAKKEKGEKKGPGVIATIVECLKGASKETPASKKHILAVLTKRFPNRAADGMGKTITVQLSGRIVKEKGLKVKHSNDGYWIGS